jgi:hypothetical protein
VTCASGSNQFIFLGLSDKTVGVYSFSEQDESCNIVKKVKLIGVPECMTVVRDKMCAVGLRGGNATGYAVIYFKEKFKVEHKMSSTSKNPDPSKPSSDIVQIVGEQTKSGFVCVTSAPIAMQIPPEEMASSPPKPQRDIRLIKEINPR